jgi:isochorismate synthase/2-succinyl-5-enolpyruvyl-6-hydroxy-3-cyclohexene-1-carboxylate synthase/2-succinyl-6-hydroxy-2,4-cyclohexadiene-1-carboxylate synthase/O-succinylbenzoate synthase
VPAALANPPLRAEEAAAAPAAEEAARKDEAAPRLPVVVCTLQTLPLESSLEAAVSRLSLAAEAVAAGAARCGSGLVRLEVPVPRGCTVLQWLRGQGGAAGGGGDAPVGRERMQAYFSPRRSSAPDTQGSAAAAAASRGSGRCAVFAGGPVVGQFGQELGDRTVADMLRFVAHPSPRVRVFGGARFNMAQAPAAEWREHPPTGPVF